MVLHQKRASWKYFGDAVFWAAQGADGEIWNPKFLAGQHLCRRARRQPVQLAKYSMSTRWCVGQIKTLQAGDPIALQAKPSRSGPNSRISKAGTLSLSTRWCALDIAMTVTSHCLPHARHMPSFRIRLWMLLFSSVVGSTASTSLSGQTPSRSISSKRLVPSPLNCSACSAWCCRMIPVVNCDDLALYRRISLYRRFLSSGFSLSTSAAIILPWYTMDLKNLEAFLPGPRQASERGVCPLAGSKWGSAFDTVQCLTFACQKQMHLLTPHLHLLTPTRHRPSSSPPTNATRFESGVVVFSLNQLHESIQSNTSAWQCVAYFPTMIFYIYGILSYMVYYVALSLCGYKCPKVYKQRILKHPVQQNANITATIYWPTSFYIHYMYYIYIYTINIYI